MATKPRPEFPMPQVSWSLGTLVLQQHPVQPPPHSKQSAELLTKSSSPPRDSFASCSQFSRRRVSHRCLRFYSDSRGGHSRVAIQQFVFRMDQCKRILKLPGEYSIWSHLGSARKAMDRQADADVAAATVTPPASHPKPNMRWRRYNPMSKLRWRKSKATAIPHVHGQKVKSVRPAATRPAAKLNYVNPLYYIRQIKNNLTNSKRQRTPA